MPVSKLEEFYSNWSAKSDEAISRDIASSIRKADKLTSSIPKSILEGITTFLDFGCGYGAFADRIARHLQIQRADGIDCSADAINFAKKNFASDRLTFHEVNTVQLERVRFELDRIVPDGVDCISLIDLLEHVPDCRSLVSLLQNYCKFFLIKLPIESSILDNYFLPKEYPGARHSNGHLREFNANDVFYFIRSLGLIPVYEELYTYHIDDALPPVLLGASLRRRVVYKIVKFIKWIGRVLLPNKVFLRLVGGGGYFCIASFDREYLLDP